MTKSISNTGIAHLKQWEGVKLVAYRDVAGIWTIGYGSTGPHVTPGLKITAQQAEDLLRKDLVRFEQAVNRLVTVPLTQYQYDALVSLAFNIGVTAFEKSTLLKVLNKGQYDKVPDQIARWNMAGGKRVQGLVNRRSAEIGLWNKGQFVSSHGVRASVSTSPNTVVAAVGGAAAAGGAAVATVASEQPESITSTIDAIAPVINTAASLATLGPLVVLGVIALVGGAVLIYKLRR